MSEYSQKKQMVKEIHIYVSTLTPRVRYAFDIICNQGLGISTVRFLKKPSFSDGYDILTINYSPTFSAQADLSFPLSGFLSSLRITPFEPVVHVTNQGIQIFPFKSTQYSFNFDLPAGLFYLLSRYEEYLPFMQDQHERFAATTSFAYRHHFLHRPLVNEWLLDIRKKVLAMGYVLPKSPIQYQFLPTYDIDIAWAFHQRPFWLKLAGLSKDAFTWNWNTFLDRSRVLLGLKNDPYQTFEWLADLHQTHQIEPIFFWLIGKRSKWDRNISPKRSAMIHLFKKVNTSFRCGLHPSYQSNRDIGLLRSEINQFYELSGTYPSMSRQHYLKLRFPTTYQSLIQHDIVHDFTMGYADQPGYRASFSGTFPWYDLSRETTTTLQITPYQVMDVTLNHYLHLSPDETLSYLSKLIKQCIDLNIPLVSIWHNSSFYSETGWKHMKDTYRQFLAEATKDQKL